MRAALISCTLRCQRSCRASHKTVLSVQNITFELRPDDTLGTVLIDFGLATHDLYGQVASPYDIVRGTLGHIAPEAQKDRNGRLSADVSVDSYSAAIVQALATHPAGYITFEDSPSKVKRGEKCCTCAACLLIIALPGLHWWQQGSCTHVVNSFEYTH